MKRHRYDRRALRRFMAERQMTMEELAHRADVTRQTVLFLRRGLTVPLATTLAKLADALDVEPGAFYVAKDGVA